MVLGLGFRVWGLGLHCFGFRGLGLQCFEVWDLRLKWYWVWGLGFGVQGYSVLEFGV